MDAVNIELAQPINNQGKPVSAITLQPMTAFHIRRFGAPMISGADGELIYASSVISNLISALANIPLPAVDQMTAFDWLQCAKAVIGFLSLRPASTPPPTS